MPGFDPNEPRDPMGKWTAEIAGAMKVAASDKKNNFAELLNGQYATEQQFREAYDKIINGQKEGNAGADQTGTGSTGRSGSEGQVSEHEKEQLQESVTGYIDKYGKQFGLEQPPSTKVVLDEARSSRISDAYDKLINNPGDPQVRAAYSQLAKEVDAQYNYLTSTGIKFKFSENDPYGSSKEMVSDVVNNHSLKVYSGGEDHPLLGQVTKDANGLTANEKFRAVHDYYGHAVEQNQFGKLGEERAWVAHSKMFSPLAQSAMTTETRGQNSWVNFSGANTVSLAKMTEGNKMIKAGNKEAGSKLVAEGQKEFKFAEQKVGILPAEFLDWKVYKN
jgi:hypothetical protein